jgi:hypothetical protein
MFIINVGFFLNDDLIYISINCSGFYAAVGVPIAIVFLPPTERIKKYLSFIPENHIVRLPVKDTSTAAVGGAGMLSTPATG